MSLVTAPRSILTSRLELTPPRAADARAIFERYAGDPEATRFLAWPRHRSMADTELFLAFSADEWKRWPAGPYLIRSRLDGRLLGSTGYAFTSPAEAATGYVLARDAWGHGYATEALSALVDLAPLIGIARLFALCHPDHRASQRVLEKCGFTRDWSTVCHLEFPNLSPAVNLEVLHYERLFASRPGVSPVDPGAGPSWHS